MMEPKCSFLESDTVSFTRDELNLISALEAPDCPSMNPGMLQLEGIGASLDIISSRASQSERSSGGASSYSQFNSSRSKLVTCNSWLEKMQIPLETQLVDAADVPDPEALLSCREEKKDLFNFETTGPRTSCREKDGGNSVDNEDVVEAEVRHLILKVMRKRDAKKRRKKQDYLKLSLLNRDLMRGRDSSVAPEDLGRKKLLRGIAPVLSQFEPVLPPETSDEKELREVAAESCCGRRFARYLERRHHLPPRFLIGEAWH
jgi:hypothetical protein